MGVPLGSDTEATSMISNTKISTAHLEAERHEGQHRIQQPIPELQIQDLQQFLNN